MQQRLGIAYQMAKIYWPYSHYAAFFGFFKTLLDPFYLYLYESNPITDGVSVVDLGAGKGLFAGWQMAMKALFDSGDWPPAINPPPRHWHYEPIESNSRDSKLASALLGKTIPLKGSDLLETTWNSADIILMIDVMQYIPKDRHEWVLHKIKETLRPNGHLLMRIGDESKPVRHLITRITDRFDAFLRGALHLPIANTRTIEEWQSLLIQSGFQFKEIPMNRGTPFSNTLLIATKA